VILEEIRVAPYSLRLRRPWHGAAAVMERRSGWLVSALALGLCGYGDCSPPPSASEAEIAASGTALGEFACELRGCDVDAALEIAAASGAPAPALCALDSALLDLKAQAADVSLARLLSPHASATVRANASLGILDGEAVERARVALAAGYGVLKVKVGALPQAEEVTRLEAIAAELPAGSMLRLDANRAWDADAARRFVARVSVLPIETLEEPLVEPTPESFDALQRDAPFALALDESLPQWLAEWPGAALGVPRWVLKPMRWGGARRCLVLARRAARAGVECVVTTTVDSAAGCWLAAHLAAALDNGLAHGLGTSEWLADDLGPAPVPIGGEIALPARGLGFALAGQP